MKSTLRLFCLCLWLWCGLALAAPRAWLDRNDVILGDTVTLNLEADGGGEPDFSVLEKDFRVVGRSSNSQISIDNGRQRRSTLWALALEPLHEGVIGIPSFTLGNGSTEPLTLTVRPTPTAASTKAGDDVFIEVEMQPSSAYVQQQVLYSIRLFYAVNLLEGQIDEPQVADAEVRRIGSDSQSSRMLADRRYVVVERRYLITPQQSGTLKIAGPRFKGRIARPGSFGSIFDPGSSVTVRGAEQVLEVRASPRNASQPWMPARQVQYRDDAQVLPQQLRVGEPVTLSAELVAIGLTAEQLPELTMPAIDGAQVYPDQESAQTADSTNATQATRSRKFAIVPSVPGTLELPERVVTWWNVDTDKPERAVLPARSFTVVAATNAATTSGTSLSSAADQDPGASGAAVPSLWRVAAIGFAVLWVLTLLAWRLSPRQIALVSSQGDEVAPASERPGPWRNQFLAALAHEDLPAARRALLLIAPGTFGLSELAEKLGDDAQRDAVTALERVLYRGESDEGMVHRLREAFANGAVLAQAKKPAKHEEGLPPLYR